MLGNADGGARLAGLTNMGKELAAASTMLGVAGRRHIFDDWQHAFLAARFISLIHGDGGAQNSGADAGRSRVRQALHRAVLAEGAMEHGEDHVDFGLRAGLGQNRPRAPLAVEVDKVFDCLVFLAIQAGQNRLGRAYRDFVLPGSSAVKHGYS